jgi:hypothetical protein
MIGSRSLVALGMAGVITTASVPSFAQVGLPGYQPVPPGYSQNGPGYGQGPQMRYANPLALGFGIALMVVGAGMLAGGFVALAEDTQNQAIGPALIGLGGTFFAASIPLVIVGAQQVPVYPAGPPGYGPGMSRRRWIGSPKLVLPTSRNGQTFAVGWGWEL